MISIMDKLQQYVPTISQSTFLHDPVTNDEVELFLDKFHYVLFGGDQLTVERAVGSKHERSNEHRGINRLDGLIPVVEDWHAKVALLKVSTCKRALFIQTCMHYVHVHNTCNVHYNII